MAAGEPARVTVVVALGAREVLEVVVSLPEGTRLREAIAQLQAMPAFADVALASMPRGLWGQRVAEDQPLDDGDRLEFYRPLLVDPKVARRERFARQGARATGLFAKRRPGGKAGY